MRAPSLIAVVSVVAALALVACVTHEISTTDGQYGNGDDDDGGTITASDLPACGFSTTLAEAGSVPVAFGRTFLECDEGTGAESCLSADPTTCPDHGSSLQGGGTTISCSDQCATTQYAISVDLSAQVGPDGGPFFPGTPSLPDSCEQAVRIPGGKTFYCCDCP